MAQVQLKLQTPAPQPEVEARPISGLRPAMTGSAVDPVGQQLARLAAAYAPAPEPHLPPFSGAAKLALLFGAGTLGWATLGACGWGLARLAQGLYLVGR